MIVSCHFAFAGETLNNVGPWQGETFSTAYKPVHQWVVGQAFHPSQDTLGYYRILHRATLVVRSAVPITVTVGLMGYFQLNRPTYDRSIFHSIQFTTSGGNQWNTISYEPGDVLPPYNNGGTVAAVVVSGSGPVPLEFKVAEGQSATTFGSLAEGFWASPQYYGGDSVPIPDWDKPSRSLVSTIELVPEIPSGAMMVCLGVVFGLRRFMQKRRT